MQIIVIIEIKSRDLILYIMTIATKSTFDVKITLTYFKKLPAKTNIPLTTNTTYSDRSA